MSHTKFPHPSPVWTMLESFLLESNQFRGVGGVTFKALNELIKGKGEQPGILGRPAMPEGEGFKCEWEFDPKIWSKWFPSLTTALNYATSADDQHVGAPQGGTILKKNYGGQVMYGVGKPRTDFEALPSAMDRYDVLMAAEITKKTHLNRKTKKVEEVEHGVLRRMAYSPAIGSSDERRKRLLSLFEGQQAPALRRRVQPHRPGVVPDPTKPPEGKEGPGWDDMVKHSVTDVPRQGGRMGLGAPIPRSKRIGGSDD